MESSAASQPSAHLSTLFTLTDPAEAFMAGWISRLHLDRPRLYRALAMKRAEQRSSDKAERLIFELALWQGRPRCYLVIIWNIDEISARWKEFSTRKDAQEYYCSLP